MKAIHRLTAVAIGVAGFSATVLATPLEGWSVDLDKAFQRAKTENKSVLVEFTGTDWCPPCVTMRKNVFSKKEFVAAAYPKVDDLLKHLDATLKTAMP